MAAIVENIKTIQKKVEYFLFIQDGISTFAPENTKEPCSQKYILILV
jgi:hypothetical protein